MCPDDVPVKFPTLRKSRYLCVPVDKSGVPSIESLSPSDAFLGPTQLF